MELFTVQQFGVELLAVVEVFRAGESGSRIFLGDDFQISFRMQFAWYDSGYVFESVYGGGLLMMVFPQPPVSGSHLFVAGLPEEHRYADILGDDFQSCFRIQRSIGSTADTCSCQSKVGSLFFYTFPS